MMTTSPYDYAASHVSAGMEFTVEPRRKIRSERILGLRFRTVVVYFLTTFQNQAPVAQGIEHRIPNPGVACSNHAGGTNLHEIR